jgi:hypothetical protein
MRYYCDNKRHLVCLPYSIHNLHAMARALHIARGWFHAGEKAHYDIPKGRISQIQAQCQLVRPRDILAIIQGATHEELFPEVSGG